VKDYTSAFPLPFLLVVSGYSLILMFDRVVIDASHDAHPHEPVQENDAGDREEIKE